MVYNARGTEFPRLLPIVQYSKSHNSNSEQELQKQKLSLMRNPNSYIAVSSFALLHWIILLCCCRIMND
jgi:hypothetical protein